MSEIQVDNTNNELIETSYIKLWNNCCESYYNVPERDQNHADAVSISLVLAPFWYIMCTALWGLMMNKYIINI